MTAHSYMLDLLGNVTSTVSSCQHLRGCVFPNDLSALNFHASGSPMRHTRCVIIAFGIIFCPCILSVSCFVCIDL